MTKLGATSYRETSFGVLPRTKLLPLELAGTKKGLEYLHDLIKLHGKAAISSDIICQLHDVSFGWIFPKWAGRYRTIQVTFSGKEAPPYYQVPELVFNLCRDLSVRLIHLPKRQNEEFIIKVVELLAWFQHRFVFIHPFQDYNGRTARMLTICVLLQLNLPPIELKAETGADRKRYLDAMRKADTGNHEPLEMLVGKALSEALT